MGPHDISTFGESVRAATRESAFNCKEALYFFLALFGLLAVILVVLPS
jgi:hypothetical protein